MILTDSNTYNVFIDYLIAAGNYHFNRDRYSLTLSKFITCFVSNWPSPVRSR